MRHNEHALLPHINGSVNEYLARTGMRNQQVWGTDIEIIAASSLLETDIIFMYIPILVFYINGKGFRVLSYQDIRSKMLVVSICKILVVCIMTLC